jgi:hypothetical protein
MGSSNPLTKPIQKLSIQSNSESQVSQVKQDKYAKIEDCPSPEENFGDWLKYQKTNWRKIRKTIKDDKKVIKDTNK